MSEKFGLFDCDEAFADFVEKIKSSGLKLNRTSRDDHLDEDMVWVLTYLRHRNDRAQKGIEASKIPAKEGVCVGEKKDKEDGLGDVPGDDVIPAEDKNWEMPIVDDVEARNKNFFETESEEGEKVSREDLEKAGDVKEEVNSEFQGDNRDGVEECEEEIDLESCEKNEGVSRDETIGEEDMAGHFGNIPGAGRMAPSAPQRIQLGNVKAKTEFRDVIEGYKDIRVKIDPDLPLEITVSGEVSSFGLPAGEYKFEGTAVRAGHKVRVEVRLSVIPRPQDLWISIPSDQEHPLAKPDESFDKIEGVAFMAAASKRGRSHAKEGTFRDDHFKISYDENTKWHVMVVADGAGSASLSREGSRVVCETATERLLTLLPSIVDPSIEDVIASLNKRAFGKEYESDVGMLLEKSLGEAARSAAQALNDRALELEEDVQSLSTTLAIAVAKYVKGQWLLLSFSIGDGGIGVWQEETDDFRLMCESDSGEFAGQTRFLSLEELSTGRSNVVRLFAEVVDDFTAFMAMTDGITDPKFETDSGLMSRDRWKIFWNEDLTQQIWFSRKNEELGDEFLSWMDFWSRGNHDDRTLAVMIVNDMPAKDLLK